MSEYDDKTAASEPDQGQQQRATDREPSGLADLMRPDASPVGPIARAQEPAAVRQQAAAALDEERPRPAAPPPSSIREQVLGWLFGLCLLAIVVTLMLPGSRAPVADPAPRTPAFDDPVVAAFAFADRRDYGAAIDALERYLETEPALAPARRAGLLLALEHYAAQLGDAEAADRYGRSAAALREQLRGEAAGR